MVHVLKYRCFSYYQQHEETQNSPSKMISGNIFHNYQGFTERGERSVAVFWAQNTKFWAQNNCQNEGPREVRKVCPSTTWKCEYAFSSSTYKISFRSTVLRIRKLFIWGTSDKWSLRSDWHTVVCLARCHSATTYQYQPNMPLPNPSERQVLFEIKTELVSAEEYI